MLKTVKIFIFAELSLIIKQTRNMHKYLLIISQVKNPHFLYFEQKVPPEKTLSIKWEFSRFSLQNQQLKKNKKKNL